MGILVFMSASLFIHGVVQVDLIIAHSCLIIGLSFWKNKTTLPTANPCSYVMLAKITY